MQGSGREFKRDGAGHPIAGGSAILVANHAIDDSNWTPIIMSANESCKQLLVKERGDGEWKLAAESDGDPYFTVTSALSMEIAKVPGDGLFYAQMSSGNGTLEFIYVD